MHKVRRIMWNYQEADGMQPTQELVLREQEVEVMCREPDTRRQRECTEMKPRRTKRHRKNRGRNRRGPVHRKIGRGSQRSPPGLSPKLGISVTYHTPPTSSCHSPFAHGSEMQFLHHFCCCCLNSAFSSDWFLCSGLLQPVPSAA